MQAVKPVYGMWRLHQAADLYGGVNSGFSFFFKIYLFIRDTERGRDPGKERSRLPVGSLIQDSIPEPWDYPLKADAQPLSHTGALNLTLNPCVNTTVLVQNF